MMNPSPLFATTTSGMYSTCVSPATSTDSLDDGQVQLSPTKLSLPTLHFAISHRRTDLRLPSFTSPSSPSYETAMPGLQLSMSQCETPHYLPGVPTCPETSPTEKKPQSKHTRHEDMDDDEESDVDSKKRKKGTRRGTLNAEAKSVLKAWMFSPEHFAHPYPSEEEKEELANEAGIEVKQLSNWFTNARKRLWQPVLRQSGVEVKNFLSTGRGGPRGNKLDVPPNLQHLITSKDTPPPSPSLSTTSESTTDCPAFSLSSSSGLKRSWSDASCTSNSVTSSPAPSTSTQMDQVAPKKKKTNSAVAAAAAAAASRKRSKKGDAHSLTKTASQLSQELRQALVSRQAAMSAASSAFQVQSSVVNAAVAGVASFKELEILAAASLLGLNQQAYQPVH